MYYNVIVPYISSPTLSVAATDEGAPSEYVQDMQAQPWRCHPSSRSRAKLWRINAWDFSHLETWNASRLVRLFRLKSPLLQMSTKSDEILRVHTIRSWLATPSIMHRKLKQNPCHECSEAASGFHAANLPNGCTCCAYLSFHVTVHPSKAGTNAMKWLAWLVATKDIWAPNARMGARQKSLEQLLRAWLNTAYHVLYSIMLYLQ